MKHVQLGKSGLRVSQLCLGTMDFGPRMEEATACAIIDTAREYKINFIDTADAYTEGESEKNVGRLIKSDRDAWVLATKVGQQDGTPELKKGLSRKWMMQAIDQSLKRLGTDYVDIYYMHHRDDNTQLIESIEAMRDIIAKGKAHYWGFSNHYGWEIGEIIRICDLVDCPRPIVAQPLYNLLMRMAENDYLPACAHYGIGVAPFSPLARGALTGKYAIDASPPPDSRAARGDKSILTRDFSPQVFSIVDKLKHYVSEKNMTPAEFSILWVLNCAAVNTVIAGPRTLEHWLSYIRALRHEFKPEDEKFAETLVSSGHPATPGLIWQRHPPLGRRAINLI